MKYLEENDDDKADFSDDDDEDRRSGKNKVQEHVDGEEEYDDQTWNKNLGEHDLQREDGTAIPLMPFNLKEDKENGSFDASGNYVWNRRDREDEEEQDAWLASVDESKGAMIYNPTAAATVRAATTAIE